MYTEWPIISTHPSSGQVISLTSQIVSFPLRDIWLRLNLEPEGVPSKCAWSVRAVSQVRRYLCPLPAPVGTNGGKQKGEGGCGRRGRRGRDTVKRKRKEGRAKSMAQTSQWHGQSCVWGSTLQEHAPQYLETAQSREITRWT